MVGRIERPRGLPRNVGVGVHPQTQCAAGEMVEDPWRECGARGEWFVGQRFQDDSPDVGLDLFLDYGRQLDAAEVDNEPASFGGGSIIHDCLQGLAHSHSTRGC